MTETHADGGAGGESRPRLTPYELVFAPDDFEARLFPRLREEAELYGLDPAYPDQFQRIPAAAEAIRTVVPPDAPPEALEQYRAILHQAFSFWRYGKRVYLLEPAVARFLVEAAPRMEGWEFAMPHPSLYVQLPANLFWGSITPESTPEPVDGFFVTGAEAVDGLGKPFHRLEVLVVLGIRRDRAGFSVIPFDTEAGPGIAAAWSDAPGREGAADFANILPGGEISGLYSLLTVAEVLKLLGRALWYVERHPADIALELPPERRAADRPDSPPLPRLPYHRVRLGGEGREEG